MQGNYSKQINENIDLELGPDKWTVILADKNLQAHQECEKLVSEPDKDKSQETRTLENSGKRSKSSVEV